MLRSRERRVAKLGNIQDKWAKLGDIQPGDFKGGTGMGFFVHAGREQASLKTQGAFLQLTPKGTRIEPGPQFQVNIPFGRASFGEFSFNPLADQASSAAFPVPTFVRSIPALDPDIAVLAGIVEVLAAAAAAVNSNQGNS